MDTKMACPFCGYEGSLKFTRKKNRPYWSCHHCLSRTFLNTEFALAGFAVVSGMVREIGREEWHKLLAQRAPVAGGAQAPRPQRQVPPTPSKPIGNGNDTGMNEQLNARGGENE